MAEQQGKIPIPALPITEVQAKRIMIKEWKKAVSEQKRAVSRQKHKAVAKEKAKTRVYIGDAYERWRLLKEAKALRSDADVALLLIDHYDRISKCPQSSIDVELESNTSDDDGSSPSTPEEHGFQTPRTPSPPHDSSSLSDRSTHQEPLRPTKPGLNDVHKKYGDSVEVNTNGATYIPAQSIFRESTLSQDSLSINVAKYIVDEYCLLQLFEHCPECDSMCEVQMTPTGTFLAVHQLCPKCHYSRNWRSQQREMAVPCGNPHSCTSDAETSQLKAHKPVHTRENPYRCQHCDKSFKYNISLKSHIQRYHGQVSDPGEEVQMEQTSTKEFKVEKDETIKMDRGAVGTEETEQSMETLLNNDENGDEMDKEHWSRAKKLVHEQSHPPAEKPYQCPEYPEVFARMREHTDHLVVHSGPKKHICHICNMDFSSDQKLQRHLVLHTKVKQFVCEVCQRSFSQTSNLKSHMRVHTGEKPYQCQHCAKSFSHKVSLKLHLQRYHGQVQNQWSEAENDVAQGMESSAVDAEETEQSKDTKNGAEEEGKQGYI